MKNEMGQLLLIATLFWGAAIGAEVEGADSGVDFQPYDVFVLLNTVQEEMLGPSPRSNPGWVALRELSAFFGPGGMLIGSSMQGLTTLARRNVDAAMADGVQSATGTFNFEVAVVNTINQLDFDSNWLLYDIQQGDFAQGESRAAKRILDENTVEYVLLIHPTYFVSPELNQIRLRYVVRMYSPSKTSSRLTPRYVRYYEYLSPSRGDILRPFHDGEKEALIASVEAQYADLVARYPANRKAYSQESNTVYRDKTGNLYSVPRDDY